MPKVKAEYLMAKLVNAVTRTISRCLWASATMAEAKGLQVIHRRDGTVQRVNLGRTAGTADIVSHILDIVYADDTLLLQPGLGAFQEVSRSFTRVAGDFCLEAAMKKTRAMRISSERF